MDYDVSVVMYILDPDLKRIRNGVESVLKEQDCAVQLIVVNDGSVFSFSHHEPSPVNYAILNLTQNVGIAEAINSGLAFATGEYCTTLGDDWFVPHSLGKVVAALRGSDDPVNTFGYGDVMLPQGLHQTEEWSRHQPGDRLKTSGCVVFHRSHLATCRFYHPPDMEQYFWDYDFVLQLEHQGCKGMRVPGALLVHDPGEQTRKNEQMRGSIERVMWDRRIRQFA